MKNKLVLLMFCILNILMLPLTAETKAVIFDFGGVIGNTDKTGTAPYIQRVFGISSTQFATAYQEQREWMKKGMTPVEFWSMYAQRQGIYLPDCWKQEFGFVLYRSLNIESRMFELIEELKQENMQVGLLSNVTAGKARLLHELGVYTLFNPLILSSEVKLNKPDPRIYELLLRLLNLPSKEVIFIDDKEANIKAAKRFGIDGILFESEPQLRNELQKRGLLQEKSALREESGRTWTKWTKVDEVDGR